MNLMIMKRSHVRTLQLSTKLSGYVFYGVSNIRVDDIISGIRPIQEDCYSIYEQILDCFQNEGLLVYLGVVPALLNSKCEFLKKYDTFFIAEHGYDHKYFHYSKILIEANDLENERTIGVFNEFENESFNEIKEKLIKGKKILTDYFKKEIDTYIPVCNICDANTVRVINEIGYKNVLSQNKHEGLNAIASDYYGRINGIDYSKNPKTFCFHITWELSEIKKDGFYKWYENFKKFADYYHSVHDSIPIVYKQVPERKTPYHILFKFPIRQRVEKLFSTLDIYYKFITDKDNFQFLINIDKDDAILNDYQVLKRLEKYKNLTVSIGNSKNKIEAVNINMPEAGWDICVLVSDDMIPQVEGFDNIIREKMQSHFPDTDGVLFFSDGHQKENLNTLCIFGKKYYQRFGYIYNPQYHTVGCDREYTDEGYRLKKQIFFPEVIIEHQHPVWQHTAMDELYKKNENNAYEDDKLYYYRKNIGFPLGIPKIAYFYWDINTPLSYLRYQTLVTFRKRHTDWQMKLFYNDSATNKKQQWSDMPKQDFTEYKGKDYIMEVKKLGVEVQQYVHNFKDLNPNYISDLFRYEQLYKTGGWWFDLDQLILKNFDIFTNDYEFVFGGKKIIYNGVIGACYHSPICLAVMERQKELLKGKIDNYCKLGNWCLSDLFHDKPELFKGSKIMHVGDEGFYPILESHDVHVLYEQNSKVDIDCFVGSYAIHIFGGHPDTQKFNNEFTFEFAKTSNDSISRYLRNNNLA